MNEEKTDSPTKELGVACEAHCSYDSPMKPNTEHDQLEERLEQHGAEPNQFFNIGDGGALLSGEETKKTEIKSDDEFRLIKEYISRDWENKTLFLEFFQKDDETKLIYYNGDDKVTLIIDREAMLPKSLQINNGKIYADVSESIKSVSPEDRAIIENTVKSKLTFDNGINGGGDPIIFSLEYLLIEKGYGNIVFDDVDFKILKTKNSLDYSWMKYEEMTEEEKKEKEEVLEVAKKDMKKRIYAMLQKRPADGCIIMPYVNFVYKSGQRIAPPHPSFSAHAITLIIRTDKGHNIIDIGIIDSAAQHEDCFKKNNGDEYDSFKEVYMGLSMFFPLEKIYVVPTVRRRNSDTGNVNDNNAYQGKESCFFMAKETSGFLQGELNKERNISRVLKNFSDHGVYRVIDKVKKDMPEPDKWNCVLDEEYNDKNYNSFTTPSIKETIGKMKTDENLSEENIKEMLTKMLIFSHKKAIGLKTVTKRLITCRRYLRRENEGYAKMFDDCYVELGKKDIENDSLKFRKKNYKNKEIKNELLKKTKSFLDYVIETEQDKIIQKI